MESQAIKHGNLRNLEDSIENMEKHAGTCPGPEGYLDVCYLQQEMSLSLRERTYYYMGLLAHAGICGHQNLVKKLIEKKASKNENRITYKDKQEKRIM